MPPTKAEVRREDAAAQTKKDCAAELVAELLGVRERCEAKRGSARGEHVLCNIVFVHVFIARRLMNIYTQEHQDGVNIHSDHGKKLIDAYLKDYVEFMTTKV